MICVEGAVAGEWNDTLLHNVTRLKHNYDEPCTEQLEIISIYFRNRT